MIITCPNTILLVQKVSMKKYQKSFSFSFLCDLSSSVLRFLSSLPFDGKPIFHKIHDSEYYTNWKKNNYKVHYYSTKYYLVLFNLSFWKQLFPTMWPENILVQSDKYWQYLLVCEFFSVVLDKQTSINVQSCIYMYTTQQTKHCPRAARSSEPNSYQPRPSTKVWDDLKLLSIHVV